MQRTFFTILAALSIVANLHSQHIGNGVRQLSVHVAPLSFIDPFPRWRFGLDFAAGNKVGLSLDVGVGTELSMWDRHALRLFEVRPEVQYYFRGRGRASPYFAFELFYIKASEELAEGNFKKK